MTIQSTAEAPLVSIHQKTLAKKLEFSGFGVFSGDASTVIIEPAEENVGIIFKDMSNGSMCKAVASNVISTARCTTIGNGECAFTMVEHVLSALRGCGIDNAIISVSSQEVPMLDGSSMPYVDAINDCGYIAFPEEKKVFDVTEPLYVGNSSAYIVILPQETLSINYTLSYPGHSWLHSLYYENQLTSHIYINEIAESRTFILQEELDMLLKAGVLKSHQLDAGLILDNEGAANNQGLRFKDEPVRHKVLDIIGDLSLAPLFRGQIIACKSGHSLNVEMAKLLTQHFIDQREVN